MKNLYIIAGCNGAGKTTTIKMLSCLTQPTSGDAFVYDKSVLKDASAVKSLIAISPQETAVAPGLSVKENLELICGIHKFKKDNVYKLIILGLIVFISLYILKLPYFIGLIIVFLGACFYFSEHRQQRPNQQRFCLDRMLV